MKLNKLYLPVLITALALSTNLSARPLDETEIELCEVTANLAETVMLGRQEQVGISQHLKSSKGMPEEIVRKHREIVLDAYRHPLYNTEKYKQRAAQEFKDSWHMKCLKTVGK